VYPALVREQARYGQQVLRLLRYERYGADTHDRPHDLDRIVPVRRGLLAFTQELPDLTDRMKLKFALFAQNGPLFQVALFQAPASSEFVY
jgi:hypothetical protein